MNNVKFYGSEEPRLAAFRRTEGGRIYTVNYGAAKTLGDDGSELWEWKSAELPWLAYPYDGLTYALIVSALVEAEYANDEMWAITNNYLANPSDSDVKAEWDAMQAWRSEAKEIAKAVLEYPAEPA
ncbi:MAG: hypothetical protein LIP02_10460 [Bacteroidales bacterium]|nr:hypothetical protein [Bacteroidales bacterium]